MWGTEKHCALLEEMQIDSVHVTKRNSIQVKFTLEHFKGTSKEMALLDTGAMESFIDHESVLRLKLGTQKLPISRPIYNVDRTKNQCGSITYVCHLLVRKENRKETMPFYVTDLGNDHFIFGYPWCQDFKPEIDWENSILKGPKIKVKTLLHGKYQHIKEYVASMRKTQENKDDLVVNATDTPETPQTVLEELEESLHEEVTGSGWSGVTAPKEECGQVLIRRTHNAIEMAHEYAKNHRKTEVTLPEIYKRHAALFSDEEAKKFPPLHPHDHKIELTEDAPAQFNMHQYPMSAKERAAEDKFLDENIEKGYIMPSESPYGFATFQVPKKDSDEMQYIIDYRPLNKVT
jgi:hypothetical protein